MWSNTVLSMYVYHRSRLAWYHQRGMEEEGEREEREREKRRERGERERERERREAAFSERVPAQELSVLKSRAPSLSLVCFRVASIRPRGASRRFALLWLRVRSRLVLTEPAACQSRSSCVHLPKFPVSVFSPWGMASPLFKWTGLCYLRPWLTRSCFLECDGYGFWRLINCCSCPCNGLSV